MEVPEQQPGTESDAVEESELTEEAAESILGTPHELNDVILEVEGRELHANRAVLAHYSRVFHKMFFSELKDKSATKVPLPGKTYKAVASFFKVLFPGCPSAKRRINDGNLSQLLALADEYETDQVKVQCQSYIGDQINTYYRMFYKFHTEPLRKHHTRNRSHHQEIPPGDMNGQNMTKSDLIDKLILYIWACDNSKLSLHRRAVKSLLVDVCTDFKDLSTSKNYPLLSPETKADVLEAVCTKFSALVPK